MHLLIRSFAPLKRGLKHFQAPLIVAFFAISTVAVTWPLLRSMADTIHDPVDGLLQATILGWNANQLLTEPLHLYEAPIFFPYPHTLAYTDSMVPQSLLALPVILSTGNYALCEQPRSVIRVRNERVWHVSPAAKLGCRIMGRTCRRFCLYIRLLSPQSSGTSKSPLHRVDALDASVLASGMASGKRLHWVLFGIFFWLSALSSFYYAFFTLALVGIYFIYRLISSRGRLAFRVWSGLAVTMVVVFALSLPSGLPYIELARDYGRTRSLGEIAQFSANLWSYLASSTQNPALVWANRLFRPPNFEAVLAPGYLALLLRLYGVARRVGRSLVLFLLAVALVGVVFSLGAQVQLGQTILPLPYGIMYDYVPGLNAMRAVARWGVLVLFATAAIAGLAWSDAVRFLGRGRLAQSTALGCMMLFALFLEYNQSPLSVVTNVQLSRPIPPVYTWLSRQPLGATVELPADGPSTLVLSDPWYQYFSLFDHKPRVNGYSGFAPPSYDQLQERLDHFPSADAIDLLQALKVRYVIVHTQALPDWPRDESRLDLYKKDLVLAASFGGDYVFELVSNPQPVQLQFTVTAPSSATPSSDLRGFLVARVASGHATRLDSQGTINVRVRWLNESGQTIGEEAGLAVAPLTVDESGVVVPFDFRAPSASGTYRVLFDVSALVPIAQMEQNISIGPEAASNPGPAVQLTQYLVPRRAARGGTTLDVILFWRVLAPVAWRPDVFVHVLDSGGRTRAELDAELAPSQSPLALRIGQVIVTRNRVPLPPGLPQGEYSLLMGLFDPVTSKPVPIVDPDGHVDQVVNSDGRAWIGAGWNQKPLLPSRTLNIRWSNGTTLAGYNWRTEGVEPGQTAELVLDWQARERPEADYAVFVHVLSAEGTIVAQGDGTPMGGTYPTLAWNDGEWVRDVHSFQIPRGLAPGRYAVQVGWYRRDTGERAVAELDDGTRPDSVSLEPLQVISP